MEPQWGRAAPVAPGKPSYSIATRCYFFLPRAEGKASMFGKVLAAENSSPGLAGSPARLSFGAGEGEAPRSTAVCGELRGCSPLALAKPGMGEAGAGHHLPGLCKGKSKLETETPNRHELPDSGKTRASPGRAANPSCGRCHPAERDLLGAQRRRGAGESILGGQGTAFGVRGEEPGCPQPGGRDRGGKGKKPPRGRLPPVQPLAVSPTRAGSGGLAASASARLAIRAGERAAGAGLRRVVPSLPRPLSLWVRSSAPARI